MALNFRHSLTPNSIFNPRYIWPDCGGGHCSLNGLVRRSFVSFDCFAFIVLHKVPPQRAPHPSFSILPPPLSFVAQGVLTGVSASRNSKACCRYALRRAGINVDLKSSNHVSLQEWAAGYAQAQVCTYS